MVDEFIEWLGTLPGMDDDMEVGTIKEVKTEGNVIVLTCHMDDPYGTPSHTEVLHLEHRTTPHPDWYLTYANEEGDS